MLMSIIQTEAYAMRLKNQEELLKSSSGGAFTALSDEFLKKGDAVVCTVYNYEKKEAEFRLVTNTEGRNAARGSKYMQSNPGDIFRECVKWLCEYPQKKMLFIGTGCQAAGFQSFISQHRLEERVLVVDIICHGVPSPRIWKEYEQQLERIHNGSITDLTFKDKRNGWLKPTAIVKINENEIPIKNYTRIFYSKLALRPSCYKCPYTTVERKVDITIGDFWHIEKRLPELYHAMGTSLVLIHTDKGKNFFLSIQNGLECREVRIEECMQDNLQRPTAKPSKRVHFWKDYHAKGIGYIIKNMEMFH